MQKGRISCMLVSKYHMPPIYQNGCVVRLHIGLAKGKSIRFDTLVCELPMLMCAGLQRSLEKMMLL